MATEPMASELWRLGAAQLTRGYRRGEFTPVDVLEAVLARATAVQPALNALCHLDKGAPTAAAASRMRWARGRPLGPLDGVPVTVKDNLNVAGQPTTWGSLLLRDFVPRADETPVARLRAAGAVLVGKTCVPEFAMQGATRSLLHGITRNPWNPALTPGGSSGGAAAAVAAGIGPLALATDGGGSIRRPASHCGLVGFKPTADLVPRGGGLPAIFLDHETAGPIARTVDDARALAAAITAMDLAPPPLDQLTPTRILYVPRFGEHPVDAGIARAVDAAAQRFAGLGHEVQEAAGLFELAEEVNELWPTLAGAGLAWMMGRAPQLPEFGLGGDLPDVTQLMDETQDALRGALQADAAALFEVQAAIRTLQQRLAAVFARHDVILTPAAAALPWPAEDGHPPMIAGRWVGPRGHAVFTAFANAAGLPAIALPCGRVGGLPVGLQLVAPAGADAALLALAGQYEQAVPWAADWPSVPVVTTLAA